MPADVVAPPGVADVGRHGGEAGLEVQRCPGDDGIPGEAHGAAVAPRPGVAGEDHAPLPLAAVVPVVALVEHPQGIKPRHAAGGTLLPVDPPEVHALLLQGVVQTIHVRPEEVLVRRVKVDGQLVLRIPAQGAAHGGIGLLVGLHAVGRVQVQRHPHAPPVQFRKERGRVGEQLPVPGVARPAAAVGHMGQVPVHVDDRHRQGDALRLEAIHQPQIALLGVLMVTAPPVAQGVAGRHGHRAGQAVEVLQAGGVVMPVAEEVQIGLRVLPGQEPAVLRQQHGCAVVKHGEAVQGHKALLHRDLPVRLVQRAGGAAQGVQRIPVAPDAVEDGHAALDRNAQPAAAEGLLVIDQVQMLGVDFQAPGRAARGQRHGRKVPAAGAGGQPVLKQTVGLIFQPHQPGGEKAQAPGAALEDGGHKKPTPFSLGCGMKKAGANGFAHLPPPVC